MMKYAKISWIMSIVQGYLVIYDESVNANGYGHLKERRITMNLYWGDLHNHCGISYGYGSLDNALAAAREQLDFCAVIGHASWFDIPERTAGLEYLVDFHKEGFAKLAANWDEVRTKVKEANVPHEFVTFQGYEAHSSKYGDYHFVSPDDDLPLAAGETPKDIIKQLAPRKVIAVPHHVGYTSGYRGGNWDSFDGRISPIVEIYSKHGLGLNDIGAYPYLHDMGPRDSRSTAFAGLREGHRFGFAGSTDHHAGYPGSYGDGRMAVLAREKTREAIWEAILARRTYAVTGDKIVCDFRLNDAPMGSEVRVSETRNLSLSIKACDAIDKIIVYKNLKPWRVVIGETLGMDSGNNNKGRYKIRVEMGWGNSKTGFVWDGRLNVSGGALLDVETCFRGRSVLAPAPELKDNPDINALSNRLISQSETEAEWTCTTFKNPTTLHPHTASLILEIEGYYQSVINVELNGKALRTSIGDLLGGSVSCQLEPHNSEGILLHRAIPETQYSFEGGWADGERQTDCDVYHAEVRQPNSQYAWISPIYAIT
jgi:hypothetical protein